MKALKRLDIVKSSILKINQEEEFDIIHKLDEDKILIPIESNIEILLDDDLYTKLKENTKFERYFSEGLKQINSKYKSDFKKLLSKLIEDIKSLEKDTVKMK